MERLAADAARLDGWPGLLVGDIAPPRGGPVGGHASHQTGLDADIWYVPMPAHRMSTAERKA
jgi:penicillin-insensitive murein endopeptidase